MRIETTPEEMRSRVSVHSVSSAAIATVPDSSSRAAVRFLTYAIVFLINCRAEYPPVLNKTIRVCSGSLFQQIQEVAATTEITFPERIYSGR